MKKASKAEIQAASQQRGWWEELAKLIGWRLLDWTGCAAATYIDQVGDVIRLTGAQRNAFIQAIKRSERKRA